MLRLYRGSAICAIFCALALSSLGLAAESADSLADESEHLSVGDPPPWEDDLAGENSSFMRAIRVNTARAGQEPTTPQPEPQDGIRQALADDDRLESALTLQDQPAPAPAPASREDLPLMQQRYGTADRLTDSVRQEFSELLDRRLGILRNELGVVKYPTFEIHGLVQFDNGWFNQSGNNRSTIGEASDGSDFRRVRLGANGQVTKNMTYFVQMDFAAAGRPSFTDVWLEQINVPIVGNIRAGQWKQPFSFEVYSSSRYTMFAERSLLFQAFAPFRHIGLGFYDWQDDRDTTWAASVYRSGQDQYGDGLSTNGGYSGVGRVTKLIGYKETGGKAQYLHLGAAYNYTAPDNRTSRFRTIPEYFIGENAGSATVGTSGQALPGLLNGTPFLVDTGSLSVNHYNLFGGELFWVQGSFTLQSEFMYNVVDQTNGTGLHFPGWYAQAGYFLTGEYRPYIKRLAQVDRIKVLKELGPKSQKDTGWGGFELASRISSLNLDSNKVQGGQATDVTYGLNWYLNSYAKMQLEYINVFLKSPVSGRSTMNIAGLRGQVDF